MRLLNDEEWKKWSDRKIAEQCAVHHDLVGQCRKELSGGNSQIPTSRLIERFPVPIKEAHQAGLRFKAGRPTNEERENNSSNTRIKTLGRKCNVDYIKARLERDGKMSVFNQHYTRLHPPRCATGKGLQAGKIGLDKVTA